MTLSSHQGGRTFRNNLAMFERGVLVGEASERNMQMLTMQISTILVVSKAKSFRCMSTRHFDTVNFRVVGQGSWDSRHPANKILMTFKINVLKIIITAPVRSVSKSKNNAHRQLGPSPQAA